MTDTHLPGAVQGTTASLKMMVDGTIRVSFDIPPRDAQTAFALFGSPGAPVAIARITPEAAQRHARQDTIAQLKGGTLAKLAGQFCEAEPFRRWLRIKYFPLPQTAEDAAEIIRRSCGVTSRAELDHNEEAGKIFHASFRLPYNQWVKDEMP